MGRAERTILRQTKSLLRCSDLKLWSVFRPPRYIEEPVKNPGRFRTPGRCSHGPPSPEVLADGFVQRLPQSSRLGVGTVAHPLCRVHGLRIVTACLSADCG